MLHLDDIRKTYHAGNFTQAALDGVTLTLRDNEFVAVLGPSGSGKTTLLNIVGGLDHYDSGDLVIDQVSTSDYTDRDWDTYRNNRIGFVFQSYNLIPHQTVLSNVELALTLSGVGKAERTQRAKRALDQVGLGKHIHKLPGQLSGGQMQRVAIARALINDPEILLADEPTGALDSKTSVQVMNLLQGIAQDRLVVMVTHNPELAEQYATRIVSLKDGRVVDDTRPYTATVVDQRQAKAARRTSMSFFTAIALSFKNLMTKKGRTLMTSFAGSIGIIGIAAILAIANGVNAYIHSVEEDTLSLYPLSIQTQGVNLTSLLAASAGSGEQSGGTESGDVGETQMIARMFSRIGANDLTSLKAYLDSPDSGIDAWINAIQYSYDVTPQIFAADTTDGVRQVNPNTVFSALGIGSTSSSSMLSSFGMSADVFEALPDDRGLLDGQYDTVAGHWPENDHECLLVLNGAGRISDLMAYVMGLRDPANLDQMVSQLAQGKPITVDSDSPGFTYDQLLGVSFKVVPATTFYQYDQSYGVWADRSSDEAWMASAVASGEPLTVSGIVKPNPSSTANMLGSGLYYTPDLVHHLMDEASAAPVVKQQLANPAVNVFDGKTFSEDSKKNSLSNFDFSSLIKIDQNALSELFTGDLGDLQMSLPDMDLSSALTQMPTIPAPDLTALLGGLDLNVSPETVTRVMEDTLGDYLSDVFDFDLNSLTAGSSLSGDQTIDLSDLATPVTPSLSNVLPTGLNPVPTISPSATPSATDDSTPNPDATPTPTGSPTASPSAPSSPSAPVLLPTPPQLNLSGALFTPSSSSARSTTVRPSTTTDTTVGTPTTGTPTAASSAPTLPSTTVTGSTASTGTTSTVVTPPATIPTAATTGTHLTLRPVGAPAASGDSTRAKDIAETSPAHQPSGVSPVDATTVPTDSATAAAPNGLSTSASPSASATPGPSNTPGPTPTATTPTKTGAPTPTKTPTATPSPSSTASVTPTPSASATPPALPSLPDVNQIVASFQQWFAQPDVQATFASRLADALDTSALEQQFADALGAYFQNTMQTMLTSMMSSLQAQLSVAMQATMSQLTDQMSGAMNIDPADFAKVFQFTMDPSQLSSVLMSMMNADADSLDSNLQKLGYGTLDTPSSIDIYPKDFASKQHVLDILNTYNDDMKASGQDDKVITYTDIVGTLMASVTDIISKVSSVLVAFVSISLVVSSIMIGVITYISVLERRKEIGILRALGASKRDVGNVFNAETLIVGFVAGLLGVLITIGLTLIANPIVYSLFQIHDIARLPWTAAVGLIVISMALTFLAGLIPSSAASRRDPVEALRSE